MSTAAYLRAPPAPPNDPTWMLLDGNIGWRLASSTAIETAPSDGALTLKALVGSGRSLTEPNGSFGGLVPPANVAVDRDGNVWLLDRSHGRLRRFDACACAFVTLPCTAGRGRGARHLVQPGGIAACGPNLLVVDTGEDATGPAPAAPGRILVFARGSLALRAVWQPPPGKTVAPWRPVAVACDERGRAFVADPANGAIHIFDRGGTWRRAWSGLGAISALAVDRCGRIFVLVSGESSVRILDGDGKQVETADEVDAVADCFCPTIVASDPGGRINLSTLCPDLGWLDPSGEPTDTPALPQPVFPPSGTWTTQSLDSFTARCQWHRVVVDAQIPVRCAVAFSTYTSEVDEPPDLVALLPDSAWVPVPPITGTGTEALIMSPPGRYLWLRAVLSGRGHETPRVPRIALEFPRISLRRYLPAAFAPDPISAGFADRLLAIFDQGFRSVEQVIDSEARLFDPRSAPAQSAAPGKPDMLTWLASWIGVTFDRTWPVQRRRSFLRAAVRLFACRGTLPGLRRALLLFLGLDDLAVARRRAACAPICAPVAPKWLPPPLILEHWKIRRWLFLGGARLGDAAVLWGNAVMGGVQLDYDAKLGATRLDAPPDPVRAPFAADAFAFTVFIPGRFGRTPRDRAAVGRVLATETPAHARAILLFVEPRMRIGVQASIGFDSVIGCWPHGITLDATTLGRASVLGPGDPVDPVPRIGRTSRVGTTLRLA
jgi:phage tail-like protein